ncbi:MAG: signal peptidase I [Candidatus Omnitrophota bacterium]|nr:signal peptidase I [Candidatus Omnitrophota bacterium]
MFREIIKYIILFAFFVSAFFFFSVKKGGFFYTDSGSMEPTIRPGDRMALINTRDLKRNDIIIFRDPKNTEKYLVKRVIGLPGDTVEVAGGQLYLNGKPMDESYLKESLIVYKYGLTQVPPGNLFVLGDNRNNSGDSSVWGFLPTNNLRGKVIFRYWPLNHLGQIN